MNATPSFYIIAYDLNKPGQDYDHIEKQISKLLAHSRILRSTWIVKTKRTAQEIFDLLKPALDRNDEVFIAQIDLSLSAGLLDSSIAQWISAQK
jgi:hypothetical protein